MSAGGLISDEKVSMLVDVWSESSWIPPWLDSDDEPTKKEKLVKWLLDGRRPMRVRAVRWTQK